MRHISPNQSLAGYVGLLPADMETRNIFTVLYSWPIHFVGHMLCALTALQLYAVYALMNGSNRQSLQLNMYCIEIMSPAQICPDSLKQIVFDCPSQRSDSCAYTHAGVCAHT